MNAAQASTVAEIENLARRVRWRVSGGGLLPGGARGGMLGSSGEFEGYRRYEPEDDLRQIDMKVYARLRRPMVRMLRADSMVPLTVLIDRSASMASAARDRKLVELGAFFFALARRGGDALRGFLFHDGALHAIHASRANFGGLEALLAEMPARGEGAFTGILHRVPPDAAGRGVTIILSDGLGIRDPERELARLYRMGVIGWLAPLTLDERDPDLAGSVLLRSREREPAWRGAIDARTLAEYRLRLERYQDGLRQRLSRHGGTFVTLSTEAPLTEWISHLRGPGRLLR